MWLNHGCCHLSLANRASRAPTITQGLYIEQETLVYDPGLLTSSRPGEKKTAIYPSQHGNLLKCEMPQIPGAPSSKREDQNRKGGCLSPQKCKPTCPHGFLGGVGTNSTWSLGPRIPVITNMTVFQEEEGRMWREHRNN